MNDRYGVDYAMQSATLVQKYKDSLESSYGVTHPSQSKEIYKNRNKAMVDKYGVKHAMQSPILVDRYKQSMNNHYGVDYPLQSEEVRSAMQQTMMQRYGKQFSAQVDYIFEKLKQTNLDRYGVEYPLQSQTIQKQKRIKMEDCGKWIPLELLTDFDLYYKRVIYFTNKQSLHTLLNFETRGLAGIEGAHHVDHKVSIKYGFENNIPPYIIGNINNLEMLPWRDNLYKSSNCSITIDALLKLIFN